MEQKNPSTFDRTIIATKKAIDSVYDFFSKIKNFHRELDIEGAANFYTQGVDDIILAEQKNNNLLYVGGQLKLQYIDENIFLLKLDLYFQDAAEKWVQRSTQATRALKYLTPQAVQELREKREISFEIDPPKEKAALAPVSTPAPEPTPAPAPTPAPEPTLESAPIPVEPVAPAPAPQGLPPTAFNITPSPRSAPTAEAPTNEAPAETTPEPMHNLAAKAVPAADSDDHA
mgnify:CR=1 FL=1